MRIAKGIKVLLMEVFGDVSEDTQDLACDLNIILNRVEEGELKVSRALENSIVKLRDKVDVD